ncbi:hypothetical protein QJS10_CPB12g00075 [Acorus calamus]|uniref:Uncharacterized protein n=1 Tax=Acorus calamus TaxID=4465 RepID=A0AAV9DND6_ACOCL|nr:hypothetical protein QJS10_CPB12g00075 [Acorus calamus]
MSDFTEDDLDATHAAAAVCNVVAAANSLDENFSRFWFWFGFSKPNWKVFHCHGHIAETNIQSMDKYDLVIFGVIVFLEELFMQSLHSVGFYSLSPRELIEAIRGHYTQSDEVILEDMTLPGLAEFKGHWRGSLDASGGGNGDTTADFDFMGMIGSGELIKLNVF